MAKKKNDDIPKEESEEMPIMSSKDLTDILMQEATSEDIEEISTLTPAHLVLLAEFAEKVKKMPLDRLLYKQIDLRMNHQLLDEEIKKVLIQVDKSVATVFPDYTVKSLGGPKVDERAYSSQLQRVLNAQISAVNKKTASITSQQREATKQIPTKKYRDIIEK